MDRICPQCHVSRRIESFTEGRESCFRCHAAGITVQRNVAPLGYLPLPGGLTNRQYVDREQKLAQKKLGHKLEPFRE